MTPANVSQLCTQDVGAAIDGVRTGSFVVVMTHSRARGARLGSLRLCGLIGSDTKRERFAHRLRGSGLSEATISKLVCSIGIDGIDSKEPAAIAISVAAQMMACDEAHQVRGPGEKQRRRSTRTRESVSVASESEA